MRSLTSRLPRGVKRLAPVVRERDALRAETDALRRELEAERARPRAGVHGTYVGDGRVAVATTWGGRLLLPSDDVSLMPELVARGTYDAPFTAYVQRHVRPGDTVVDVGAHVGLFTILLGYQVWEMGRVIAYEANPRMLELLRQNVSMNWLDDRIEVVPKAVAAGRGTRSFLAPRHFSMTGSLQPVEHLLATESRGDVLDRVDVEAEPLDALAGRFERIDLIKIDVEGAEEQVFAGMEALLGSGVVERVSFEIAREWIGADWDAFVERLTALREAGWTFHTISDAGLPEPVELTTVFDRGRYPQVLMQRGPS